MSHIDIGAELAAIRQQLDAMSREVLSVRAAVERLPMRDADARAWLRREGLIADLDGRQVVLWADVLDRLRTTVKTPSRATKAPEQPTRATPRSAGLWRTE